MGWIAVNLDGTLAMYDGWHDGKIGLPVPAMAERVRTWIAEGKDVRIFTARVGSGDHEEREFERKRIHDWTSFHFGKVLAVTATKDFAMIELWDDRCVQVEPNTGRRIDGLEVCRFE